MAVGEKVKALQQERPKEPPPAPTPEPEELSAKVKRAGEVLYDWIASLDPTWAERMTIMQDERGIDKLQVIGSLVAYPLEHSLHMSVPGHSAFDGTVWEPKEAVCPNCENEYTPAYPKMPFCGNRCAEAFRKRQAEQGAGA